MCFHRVARHLRSIPGPLRGRLSLEQEGYPLSNVHDLPRSLRFGQFELDLRTAEIYKEGERIKLQEQPFQVLAMLIERPGALVSREELRNRLWPNSRFVDFDHGVNVAINKLRDALGDSPEEPRFIETLRRRGYRFMAAVETIPSAPYEDLTAHTEHVVMARWAVIPGIAAVSLAAILALVIGLNIGGVRQRFLGTKAARTVQSVAVLPLENLSGDPEQAYFAEGMTDELITSLAKLQTLKVISRSSVMRYKGTNTPLPEIARELKVDGIIEGTVLRSGNRVRITVQLIRAATDQHLWAETYEGNMEDVLRLQDAVAQAIAAEIHFKLAPEVKARLVKSPSVNPAAYEAYLRGRYNLQDRWTKAGSVAASHYFEEAIARDPQYAPAYAGLADYYTFAGFTGQPFTNREAMERARDLAAKALQLDDRSADAHIAMANVLFRYDWNWTEAEKEFKRGIELNPNASSSYTAYAMYLGALGRFDEAIAAMKHAIELDPFSAVTNSDLGVVLQWAGRDGESAGQERKAIALDSFFPQAHLVLARAYEQLGRYDEAIAEHLETDTLDGIDSSAVAGFKRAYMSSGINGYRRRRMEWEKQRARSGKANYYLIAVLSAQLGDRDAAFQWLGKAYQERLLTMPNIKVAPGFRSLHGDPRFADLVRRVGLPP